MLGGVAVTRVWPALVLVAVGAVAGCARDPVEASPVSEDDEAGETAGHTSGSTVAGSGSTLGDDGSSTTSSSDPSSTSTGGVPDTDDGWSTEDAAESTGEAGCPPLVFDASWSYYSNPAGQLEPSASTELELIPDDETSRGAAVLLAGPPEPPFRLTFEYTIFDDDGGNEPGDEWSSGDGIAVMLFKDPAWYEERWNHPPTASGRGFAPDGTGVGIHFEIYGPRQIVVRNGYGSWLAAPVPADPSVYPHGEWRSVAVDVSLAEIVVHYEGDEIVTIEGPHDATHLGLGFGAGTGSADGAHQIRNVVIEACG
jgi:hypothetical protein